MGKYYSHDIKINIQQISSRLLVYDVSNLKLYFYWYWFLAYRSRLNKTVLPFLMFDFSVLFFFFVYFVWMEFSTFSFLVSPLFDCSLAHNYVHMFSIWVLQYFFHFTSRGLFNIVFSVRFGFENKMKWNLLSVAQLKMKK